MNTKRMMTLLLTLLCLAGSFGCSKDEAISDMAEASQTDYDLPEYTAAEHSKDWARYQNARDAFRRVERYEVVLNDQEKIKIYSEYRASLTLLLNKYDQKYRLEGDSSDYYRYLTNAPGARKTVHELDKLINELKVKADSSSTTSSTHIRNILNGELNKGLSVTFQGEILNFNYATISHGKLEASNKINENASSCDWKISPFTSKVVTAYLTDDNSELKAGMEFKRTNGGIGGDRNLTLAFSGPDITPWNPWDARVVVKSISGKKAVLTVESPDKDSFDGIYGVRGTIEAELCD